jgi:dihydropyrimidinase
MSMPRDRAAARRATAIDLRRDPDTVPHDPQQRRTITQPDLHPTSHYTPYEGLATSGLVRSTLVRGEFVIRDGRFIGRRGHGQFQERALLGKMNG